jgi:hypothetical protein
LRADASVRSSQTKAESSPPRAHRRLDESEAGHVAPDASSRAPALGRGHLQSAIGRDSDRVRRLPNGSSPAWQSRLVGRSAASVAP